MYKITYRQIAINDYKDSLTWYANISQEVATKFEIEVEETLDKLLKNPSSYINKYKNYHEIHLVKYPFTIVYKIQKETKTIIILAIHHQKRNPLKKYRK